MTIALVTLYVLGFMLLLAGVAAVVISYLRTRADNVRHELLNQTAAALNDYHRLVRDHHDACVTKMSQLSQKEDSQRVATPEGEPT